MVSFSNYMLKSLPNKKITYGEYGIAFKKSWVERNSINQVIYMNNNSYVSSALETLLQARRASENKFSPDVRLAIIKIKCFTKNPIGYNSYAKKHNFKFKNENEWRYVPTKKQINKALISIPASDFDKNKQKYNQKLIEFPLRFKKEDIKCIYVPHEDHGLFKSKYKELAHIIKISPWTYVDIKDGLSN